VTHFADLVRIEVWRRAVEAQEELNEILKRNKEQEINERRNAATKPGQKDCGGDAGGRGRP
jgi:hypothetical protein